MPAVQKSADSPIAPVTLDRFSQILGALYEAALNPSGWESCLENIRSEFRANFASLIVRTVTAEDSGLIVSVSSGRRTIDPKTPNLSVSPFTGMVPDKLVTIGDVLSEGDWRASAYYRDWCAPHGVYHVMAADIVTNNGGVYGFRVTRDESDPPFTAEDKELGRKLIPHIKRALNLHLSVHQDRKVISLYSNAMAHLMVGVVVLDKDGHVIESNPTAQAILELKDGLRILGNQLEATYGNDNRKLQQLIKDALASTPHSQMALTEALSVSRPSGQVSWGIVVQSISPDSWTVGKQRPAVAVFVRDTEGKSQPPIKLAQQLFQLTPAETMLAIQLANGLSLEEAAEELNIRRNTARAHLRSIFSKTGVRRQTELVRIFLNSVAWLGAKD